jgi:hypothetical protein
MVKLDGQVLFEGQAEIEAEAVKRASVERSAAGLDGVVSIDLGSRGRKIKQKGELRAASRELMRKRFEEILTFLDGKVHTLETKEGDVFEDLRMDSFKVTNEECSGAGLVADYEIEYMQIRV